jgi:hypothetical protein
MSTTTANYSFIKPDVSEASGPEEIAENMIKAERALINLEVGSATGRDNISRSGIYRNISVGPHSLNSQGAFDTLTWTPINSGSAWTALYELDMNYLTPSLGLPEMFTSGVLEIYHAGYYKVTWNLRVQMSNSTSTEGFIRASLLGQDGWSPYSIANGIEGSSVVVALNTMTDIVDIGAEQLIKVVQRERTSVDGDYNTITSGKNQHDYWDSPLYSYFTIGYAHNNNSSATATVLANETYIHAEFIRGL